MAYNERFYNKLTRFGKDHILEKYRNNGTISERDCELITEYIGEKQSQKHVGKHQVTKNASTLSLLRQHFPVDYDKVQIDHLYAAIEKIKQGKYSTPYRNMEKKFTHNTIRSYIAVLKPFMLWLIDNGYNTKLPEKKVRGIKIPAKDDNTTKAEDLPTYGEVLAIIGYCQKPMHKALMSTLYESGARIEECCSLRWADLDFDVNGVMANIPDFKTSKGTEKWRYSRLTLSTEYLAGYRNMYITKYGEDRDKFVFIGRDGEPMSYAAARQIFDRMIKRFIEEEHKKAENIKDEKKREKFIQRLDALHITPHDFRRARTVHMIQQNYQESTIKESLWGNVNSNAYKVYARIGKKDIDREFLRRAGIQVKDGDEIDTSKMPHTCDQCHTVNNSEHKHCYKCGYPLTEEAKKKAKTADEILEELVDLMAENPEIMEKYKKIKAAREAAK
jgi:integrase